MEKYRIAKQDSGTYSMGLMVIDGGIHINVASEGSECRLLLYRHGAEKPMQILDFPKEQRIGDVWSMTVLGDIFSDLEYCFESDGKLFADPYGRRFLGRETWGDLEAEAQPMRTPVTFSDFNWEGDRPLEIPYEDSIFYRIHTRGFSKHASSKVKNKGTFSGIQEKIPYFKDLGITALELLPVAEFSEVMIAEHVDGNPCGVDKPTGKLNYWGYTDAYSFAPKSSYSAGKQKDAVLEFKELVKALHKNGLELIIELYFTGKESLSYILEAARFWVLEYHVDGIHLTGPVPFDIIGQDPYLSRTKLLMTSCDGVRAGTKHLAEYNDGFLVDMRRVLKGDESEMNALIFRSRRNPSAYGVINYMANTNGFTMMDMVSYDTKHNEDNDEDNQDGNTQNDSWNCGAEGPSKKKKIVELRKKQLRNGFLLLFLSQGTPLLLSGDEFGNSQGGNNNAYCQDNEVSWLNWTLLKTNRNIYQFVKNAISFRKKHSVFHMHEEPKIMDYLACGQPDVSYHGVKAWCPEFENFRRQLGIMYCGDYGTTSDGKADNSFYVAYNMYWEPYVFDLPNLPKGKNWYVACDTDDSDVNGFYEENAEPMVTEKQFEIPARTIVVFIGR